jgi:plastocyanin
LPVVSAGAIVITTVFVSVPQELLAFTSTLYVPAVVGVPEILFVVVENVRPAGSVDVETGSFYYKPNEIRVKKGETVKITLHSVSMMHDFNIDELNVKSPIVKNGDTGTVEFVASKAGEFEYYCSVGQHRAQGQVGKLIVEE